MQIDPMTSNNCGNLIHYLLIFEILSQFPTYVISDLKVHNPTGTVRFSTQRKGENGHRNDQNHPNQNDFTKQPGLL